jgi:outer membrane protein assembly factor BamA
MLSVSKKTLSRLTLTTSNTLTNSKKTIEIKNVYNYFIYGLLFFSCFQLSSQNYTLKIIPRDSTHIHFFNTINYNLSHASLKSINKEVSVFIKKLNYKGFFFPEIKIEKKNDSSYISYVKTKKRVDTVVLRFTKKLEAPTFIPSNNDNKLTLPITELKSTLEKLSQYYEEKGRGFTEIQLNNIKLKQNTIFADIKITPSKIREIDKIIIKGYPNFPKKILNHHLKLKIGTIFNKEQLLKSGLYLKSLNFTKETKTPEVLFTDDSTHIYMYLSKKKSNRFDGLIGFSNKKDNKQLVFNGYLDIVLKNSFNQGENIALHWSNNGNNQEQFRFETTLPYITNHPTNKI